MQKQNLLTLMSPQISLFIPHGNPRFPTYLKQKNTYYINMIINK